MYKGHAGTDVAAWQVCLVDLGLDISDPAGIFGPTTHNATLSFQRLFGLVIDGVVGPKTRARIGKEPEDDNSGIVTAVKYIEAKNWSRHIPPRDRVNWVVIHCMEAPESATRAERCAARFADPENAPRASCHYCVDCDTIVQCVREDRIAWHAPGANKLGIGIEHAGYARQTPGQWLDPFGHDMLNQSAYLTAGICHRWDIPVDFVQAADLKRGKRGITTHAEVSKAFKKSSHWDPGPSFPMDWYIDKVKKITAGRGE